jgi:hypothetical protein
MLISGLQSNSILHTDYLYSGISSRTDSSQDALTSLVSSIASGDLANTKKYLTEVEQLTSPDSDLSNPLNQFISGVSNSMANDDIFGAQSALTTLKDNLSTSPKSTVANSTTYSVSSDSDTNSFGGDVYGLVTAVNAGNLNDAQSSYALLASALSSNANRDWTNASAVTPSDSSLSTQLKDVGSALDSGYVGSAQRSVDGLLTSLSAGMLVSVSA